LSDCSLKILSLIFLLFTGTANASLTMPRSVEFSCTKCHYNTLGGTGLNDFGRSYLKNELNGEWFRTSEKPPRFEGNYWWISPQAHISGITTRRNPNGDNDKNKGFLKRLEATLTYGDMFSKWNLGFTYGHLPTSMTVATFSFDPSFKQYYVRYELDLGFWVYAGLLPKVYGLRLSDHTSLSRNGLGFTPYGNYDFNESEQIIFHQQKLSSEFALAVFQGHPLEAPNLRHKGGSLMIENSIAEYTKIGLSVLSSKNQIEKRDWYAFHMRTQLNVKSALLFEQGWITNSANTSELDGSYYKYFGTYSFLSLSQQVSKSTFWINQISRISVQNKPDIPEAWKLSIGLDTYFDESGSLQLRASNDRSLTKEQTFAESWLLYVITNFYY
jgi:hypothetical protein